MSKQKTSSSSRHGQSSAAKTAAAASSGIKLIDETMEINFDRASKFYEPGEKVTGILRLPLGKMEQLKGPIKIKAESYMDTVS